MKASTQHYQVVEFTTLIPFALHRHWRPKVCSHAFNESVAKAKLTMTIAARTVGGQARWPETAPADKK